MPVNPIPDGFHTITPYLTVKGVVDLVVFLKKAFNAQEIRETILPDGTIITSEIMIGDSIIMLSESRGEYLPMPTAMYLYVQDTDKVYNQALLAGGISVMEPLNQFYGDRNAGIKDPSGNIWWIATRVEEVSNEELQRRVNEKFNIVPQIEV